MPFPLLIPFLGLKGALVGRFVYRGRRRARADRQFRCNVKTGSAGHIHMSVGARDLIVDYESSPAADFVVSRRGMKWVSGDPAEVTDEDFKLIHTTLCAWAQARGSTVVAFDT
jgi:hypothetical protein